MPQDIQTDVAIIGAGTAGLFAMKQVRMAGKSVTMIDPGPLGTTCARVGCMPSKVALHAAHLWHQRQEMAEYGTQGIGQLSLDRDAAWARVSAMRDRFAGKTEENARKAMGENLLEGPARFVEPTVLEVELPGGDRQVVRAQAVVIANGSRPVVPEWLEPLGDRVVTTDTLFDAKHIPDSVGVLGLGAIGLEMGLALSRLGVRVVGADIARFPAGISDPELGQRVIEQFSAEFPLWLGESAELSKEADGILMKTSQGQEKVDMILASLGRRPNTDTLNLAEAGFELDDKGQLRFDPATQQVQDFPVFVAGDVNGHRPLQHEARDEGTIAGFNAARGITRFRRRTPLSIAFTHPDIAVIGEHQEDMDPNEIITGSADGSGNGRSVILGAQSNLIRLHADAKTGRLRGASLMATHGEHLAHLLAWAIQRGETAQELLAMPFYHPVVEEILPDALQEIVSRLPETHDLPKGFRREE
ncbi:pyridine nucleotide-disulfide oxidoreductase dimerization region [Ectothiorhodospira sp. PHS-1]|uniref:dihydrolipoyl dehydrogenase n=1 Tax=Ectothiorhodospira sp. PHS-1 TaxID=519989 RepID=UPI00024A8ACF|nr:dihydrolipoyl dehydrogenase [Ectothiorhodospira sp. PHS-1]EHQ53733.1 pyridine nucleotide-disulfide oxidoreductase dimerization region [Ectothiorhodospira sp. PHS-1]